MAERGPGRNLARAPDSAATRDFYDALAQGDVERGLWGLAKRFDIDDVVSRPSVARHFVEVVAQELSPDDRVLDLGCGPGAFLVAAAPLCGSITGTDISPRFVAGCEQAIAERGIDSARALLSSADALPFSTAAFDAVIMVDVLHHLDQPQAAVREALRVMRPGGKLLIFEPNVLNPALALMCLADPNERGLLALGTRSRYSKLLGPSFEVLRSQYSGLLIGPSAGWAVRIADWVSGPGRRILGWLSPKLFIVAGKP